VEAVLRLHHVPENLVERLAALSGDGEAIDSLATALSGLFPFTPWSQAARRAPLMLVGPPGAGKTVLAGKIAARIRRARALLIDCSGAGALADVAKVLGFETAAAEDPASAASILARRRGVPAVLDSAGDAPPERLEEFARETGAVPLLVLPADIGPDEGVATAQRYVAIGAHRLIVTRLDIARRLGGILAGAHAAGLAFAGAATTPHFAYGLRPLTAPILARRLVAAALDGRRFAPPSSPFT
jgi:flagellar biosynthesis protein FlhF